MKKGSMAWLALGAVASIVATGCSSGSMSKGLGGADAVADRQRLMKSVGANWKEVQDKFKAGNVEGVAVNAEVLAIHATQVTQYFPKGSMTAASKAKPEIWEKWADFEKAAKNLETESIKLREAAKTKNAAATEAVLKDFGRNACGACHTPFRVPPPRQG